jgi:alpha-tubulin suppressor-like RCC1 family protein
VRTRSDEIKCWGWNEFGQLGDGSRDNRSSAVLGPSLRDVAYVGGGSTASCALHTDGRVSCWGSNELGALGIPRDQPYPWIELAPVEVAGIRNATQLSAGSAICVRRAGGTVSCWGNNGNRIVDPNPYGELGVYAPNTLPWSDVMVVDAPGFRACALIDPGTPFCWGFGVPFELDGGVEDAAGIATGRTGMHVCALMRDGSVVCWGGGSPPVVDGRWDAPATALHGAVEVDAGSFHTCALHESGDVLCWGRNDHGQLGDGTTTRRLTPQPVVGLR